MICKICFDRNATTNCEEFYDFFKSVVPEITKSDMFACDYCYDWLTKEIKKITNNYNNIRRD